MWWFNKKIMAFLFCCLLMAGCGGFQPLYGQSGKGQAHNSVAALGRIKVEAIAEREGQILYNYLLDRLNPKGRPVRPDWTLETILSTSERAVGIKKDTTTTRMSITVMATFTLLDQTGRARQFSIRRISEYDATQSNYASLVARENMVHNSLREIADDAKLRLAVMVRGTSGQAISVHENTPSPD